MDTRSLEIRSPVSGLKGKVSFDVEHKTADAKAGTLTAARQSVVHDFTGKFKPKLDPRMEILTSCCDDAFAATAFS
jgi:hypothetical protein